MSRALAVSTRKREWPRQVRRMGKKDQRPETKDQGPRTNRERKTKGLKKVSGLWSLVSGPCIFQPVLRRREILRGEGVAGGDRLDLHFGAAGTEQRCQSHRIV